jgi:hypothetical protein
MPSQVSCVASMLGHPSHSMHKVHHVNRSPEVVGVLEALCTAAGHDAAPLHPCSVARTCRRLAGGVERGNRVAIHHLDLQERLGSDCVITVRLHRGPKRRASRMVESRCACGCSVGPRFTWAFSCANTYATCTHARLQVCEHEPDDGTVEAAMRARG